MKKIFIALSILIVLLAGCQSASQPNNAPDLVSTGSLPTQLPPTEVPPTQIPPTATVLPATATPIPSSPTPTLSPEVPAKSIQDLVGTWKGRWSDSTSINTEFINNGSYRVFFSDGENIDTGWLSFEDGKINYLKSNQVEQLAKACREDFAATYEVYLTKRGDQPVKLRFVLIGEDHCPDRKEYMNGKTLTWLEP